MFGRKTRASKIGSGYPAQTMKRTGFGKRQLVTVVIPGKPRLRTRIKLALRRRKNRQPKKE